MAQRILLIAAAGCYSEPYVNQIGCPCIRERTDQDLAKNGQARCSGESLFLHQVRGARTYYTDAQRLVACSVACACRLLLLSCVRVTLPGCPVVDRARMHGAAEPQGWQGCAAQPIKLLGAVARLPSRSSLQPSVLPGALLLPGRLPARWGAANNYGNSLDGPILKRFSYPGFTCVEQFACLDRVGLPTSLSPLETTAKAENQQSKRLREILPEHLAACTFRAVEGS
ncbi:hypothetical protein VTK26DRAFT_1506 [Humicola hyalothermophila]